MAPLASVHGATAEYQHGSDKIQQFIEERLEEALEKELRTSTVYDACRNWCDQNGYYTESNRNFNQALHGTVQIVRKRPRNGDDATTLLIGYRIAGMAETI